MVFDNIYESKIVIMNRIDNLIEERYPGKLDLIKRVIEQMKTTYDEDQFLEEDILESILEELDII
jgi:hypothetical protein